MPTFNSHALLCSAFATAIGKAANTEARTFRASGGPTAAIFHAVYLVYSLKGAAVESKMLLYIAQLERKIGELWLSRDHQQ